MSLISDLKNIIFEFAAPISVQTFGNELFNLWFKEKNKYLVMYLRQAYEEHGGGEYPHGFSVMIDDTDLEIWCKESEEEAMNFELAILDQGKFIFDNTVYIQIMVGMWENAEGSDDS